MTKEDDRQRAFAALGEYVYEFSWLCQRMKIAVTSVPRLSGDAYEIPQLLMGELTAYALSGVCFSVFERAVGDDAESLRLIKGLKKAVARVIEQRNDFSHGDWIIGWISSTGVENPEGIVEQVVRDLPPTLVRIKPTRSGQDKVRSEEISVDDLESEVVRLRSVRHMVDEFTYVIRGSCRDMESGGGFVTLSDLYTMRDGKVSRTGPKATRVRPWTMF